jgi:small-conductance mechanosensitive channel
MTDAQWIMLIAIIIYTTLAAVAFKWPRTRENWTRERKESIQLLMSMAVFLILFFTLWYVSATLDWPDTVDIIVWSAAFTFLGLILIGIFAPQGIKLRFEKKKDPTVTADDED